MSFFSLAAAIPPWHHITFVPPARIAEGEVVTTSTTSTFQQESTFTSSSSSSSTQVRKNGNERLQSIRSQNY